MKAFSEKFYKSIAWIKCRKSFIESKFGLCERCGSPGKIVHHKEILTPRNIDDPYVTLNHEKLELLCQNCHNKEHMSKYSLTRDDVMFNKNGDLVKANPPL